MLFSFSNHFTGKLSPYFLASILLATSCTATSVEPEPAPSVPVTVSAEDTWAFEPEPDTYNDRALLDLRFLNETVAGESGFIGLSADGRDFVKGNGTPIRFWAVNSYIWRQGEEAIAPAFFPGFDAPELLKI